MNLAENIKKYRQKKGWTQEQLARQADITYTTLIKLESGANDNPTIKILSKLADIFNINVDDLTGRKKK